MRRTYQDCCIKYHYRIVCKDLAVSYKYEGSSRWGFYDEKLDFMCACLFPENEHYNDELYQTIRANGDWYNWEFVKIGITYKPIRKKKRRNRRVPSV